MTTTPAAGSYYNNSSITLSPNFSYTATAGNVVSIYIVPTECVPLAANPSQNQNYILTSVPRISGITSTAGLANRNACELMQTVQYFDGLGRVLQTVQIKGSPTDRDIVQPVVYDQFGRETSKYLPYVLASASTDDGSYKTTAVTDQSSFYANPTNSTWNAPGVISTPFPVSATVFEPSPINRVVGQGAPGDNWQPAGTTGTSSGAGHTVKTTYTCNNDTSWSSDSVKSRQVAKFKATVNSNQSRTLTVNGYYSRGQLDVMVVKDENCMNGRAGTVEEYKDKEGHTLLKRTYNYTTQLQILSTYYVYDDLGNLAFVIPPAANGDAAAAISKATLDNLCYQYRYDERNRLSQKKIPGKGWDFIVYNKLDQQVLSQDSLQRLSNQWMVNKYDGQGRVIMTGLYNASSVIPQNTLQASIYGAAQWDNPDLTNTNTGYNITTYPTLSKILTINYYDGYTGLPGIPSAFVSQSNVSMMTKGLLTATKTVVLNTIGNTTPDMLWTARYYDDLGRSSKNYQQHYLGGAINAGNYDVLISSYNFSNQVTASTRQHYVTAALKLTVSNWYLYDHTGKKLKTWQQIQNGTQSADTKTLISKIDYNELGQMYKKHLHSTDSMSFKQDISYNYNERGWLTKISSPLFFEQLQYNTDTVKNGITPIKQYNGNIAAQTWTNTPSPGGKTYRYKYDKLNRLTDGTSSDNFNEQNITYDLMGNIVGLSRYAGSAATTTDLLTYSYLNNGNQTNQLQTITDGSGDNTGIKTGGPFTYIYDGNGNVKTDPSRSSGTNTITYNLLNLPQTITGGKTLTYTYDANGKKLSRQSTGTNYTAYIDGIQYDGSTSSNATISFIQTEEGRALADGSTNYNYEYNLTDYLGNSRVAFDTKAGINNPVQVDDYYPFGLEISRTTSSAKNEYLYNKKELQEELSQYDYGARIYDPVIGRWTSEDRYAENYTFSSPYAYVNNNPTRNTDFNGDTISVNVNWILDLSFVGGGVKNMVTQVYFDGSTAYNQDGTEYKGNDEYVSQVSNALAELNSHEVGRNLVDYLENSTKNVTLYRRSDNYTDEVSGSYVFWNPTATNGPPDQSGNTPSRPTFISLGHELAHVEDIWNGRMFPSGSVWFTAQNPDGEIKKIKNAEKYATFRENQIRAEHGIALRTYYSPDDQGGVAEQSRIIDSRGRNLFMRTVEPPLKTSGTIVIIPPATIPLRPIKL